MAKFALYLGRVNGHGHLVAGQFVSHSDERFKNELRFLGTLQVDVYRAVFIFEFFKKL